MLCKTKTCDDVKITQESLEKELVYTKMYLKILDDWYGNLLKKSNSFRENSPTLLEVLREGVRSSLISSMCNIFTGSNEASLWRLIDQVEKTTGRVENKESYIKRIEEIHGKLNPLRNVERNHTIPWRKDKDKKIFMSEMKDWIFFAETTYKEIIKGIGLSFPLNGLAPEFDEEIKRNIDWIYSNPAPSKEVFL